MTRPQHRARAFGLSIGSDIALPHLAPETRANDADLHVRQVGTLRDRGEARIEQPRGVVYADGVRLTANRAAVFDLFDATIDYAVQAAWQGVMPPYFYSTVLALALARRGSIALHASAVAIGGRALLLCGPSGAGKSTLAAALVARGAAFIGDDLTAIEVQDGAATVQRGRITMRLHASTAAWVPAYGAAPDRRDTRGKHLVEPVRDDDWAWPLGAIALVGEEEEGCSDKLRQHLFRPRWQSLMPSHGCVTARLAQMAARTPCFVLASPEVHDRATFDRAGAGLYDAAARWLA